MQAEATQLMIEWKKHEGKQCSNSKDMTHMALLTD